MEGRTAEALDRLARAVGRRHVVTGRKALGAAGCTTFATAQRPAAIVRPGSVEEVRAVMRIASEHGVVVHPVSGGRNWGYGARVPLADGAVLLDLSRLDRIVAYDAELGSATIEAGVTQAMLGDFLWASGNRFWIDANGSSGGGSFPLVMGETVQDVLGVGCGPRRFASPARWRSPAG